jgi:hypothetical protein
MLLVSRAEIDFTVMGRPGSVELSRFPRVAMLLHEGGRRGAVAEKHPAASAGRKAGGSHAGFQADARHRNQILQGQGQPPRHPTHAAVEATRQAPYDAL